MSVCSKKRFHMSTSETYRRDNTQLKIQLYKELKFTLDFLASVLSVTWSNNNVQSLTCMVNWKLNENQVGYF